MQIKAINTKDAATTKAFDAYYADLQQLASLNAAHEQATRRAFGNLLEHFARKFGWTLVLEQRLPNGAIPDGTLRDLFLPHGYWEAKDTKDDLDAEIKKKIARGYPTKNIIFEDTRRGVLYQNGKRVDAFDLTDRAQLADLLTQFFGWQEPDYVSFYQAVREFGEQIPLLALRLKEIIAGERTANKKFIGAFAVFHELCKTALNPQITESAIEEMLVQHLLTERLFRTIFENPDFVQRNVIAAEIEKVIQALASRVFNRNDLLKRLDPFYGAVEGAARGLTDWSEKQGFLNTIYERFFNDFSRKQADTMGIVYTPQEIVDWMCASVDEVLQREFGKADGLSSEGVVILDPATGTGNFVVNLLRRIKPQHLKRKYAEELFANEIMLLPYYIAGLNIEHEYFVRVGEYLPFEGMCFADTLDLGGGQQMTMMFAEENTERVQRQKAAPITVLIGNPPYNVGQQNENDNNKNRTYGGKGGIDERVRETYGKESNASNKNKLDDPYVKFFRWAADRLQDRDGVVCLVTNNSFVNQITFDGMRKSLSREFDVIYHLDLHGNVRKNPKLSGTTHNVFGIQVGVGITVLVKKRTAPTPNPSPPIGMGVGTGEGSRAPSLVNSDLRGRVGEGASAATIYYHRVPEDWRKTEKLAFLKEQASLSGVQWQTLTPDAKNTWLTEGLSSDFEKFVPMGTKEGKALKRPLEPMTIFKIYSLGANTNRDEWMYDFDKNKLSQKAGLFIDNYNAELDRWKRNKSAISSVDNFLNYEGGKYKWSEGLKKRIERKEEITFDITKIRPSLYRPFCRQFLYFDRATVERVYVQPQFLPSATSQNLIIVIGGYDRKDFSLLLVNSIANLNFYADPAQCFPFYTYDEDGSNRRENITDWALAEFNRSAQDQGETFTKRDVFHYAYAVLHIPAYRQTYAENLKRELPRILFPQDLGAVVPLREIIEIGAALAALHVAYEQAQPYVLQEIVNNAAPFSWRVERMKLTADKTALVVNESLTLAGIPPEVFAYRLGNRSALDWVIDQYQVSTDKRSGIVTDPNREDDEQYIIRLVKQVVTVSLETVQRVNTLAKIVPSITPDP